MGGPTHGSSTGPAGAAPGYSSSTQHDHAAAEPTKTSGEGLGAGMGKTGENVGQGARDIYKGVHGAGESLRGALNGAVDKAFGSSEGMEKNQSIVQKGVNEMPRR
ncbi:hypothetical protein LTS12_027748 [Elasticomyces elasticus]|nr:hypothetical protein LTS12_027748 [Elasticomyces elasticus]